MASLSSLKKRGERVLPKKEEKGDLAWSLKASSAPINLFDL